jgi:hypothetical protein
MVNTRKRIEMFLLGKTCPVCLEPAPYSIDAVYWFWGPRPKKKEIKQLWNEGKRQYYCRWHFLETYHELLTEFEGRFIFFKNKKYFDDSNLYLDFDRLKFHPGQYTDEELSQLAALLESMGACQKCQKSKSQILLIDEGAIESSLARPLIKNKDYLKFNESLCIDCFIDYLANRIHLRRHEFSKLYFSIPYGKLGIYLFEQ